MLIKDLPEGIRELAVKNQVLCGNPENDKLDVGATDGMGGFMWCETEEGSDFWEYVFDEEFECKARNPLVLAIDFDGTCVKHEYPEIGAVVPNTKLVLDILQKRGHKLILWTCRWGEQLEDAKNVMDSLGIVFDAYNDDIEERKHVQSRKIWADIYYDDKTPGHMNWIDFLMFILKEENK